jgi:hypothetical protein
MPPEETDGRCWQCGAPANPGCVCTKNLVNKADYADGLGNPVTRSERWGTYFVKVSIPRCEACQLRNWLSGFLFVSGFFIGGAVGRSEFPSMWIATIIGAALGCVPGALVAMYYRRIRGLRSLEDYPPLKRLRECGWEDPN